MNAGVQPKINGLDLDLDGARLVDASISMSPDPEVLMKLHSNGETHSINKSVGPTQQFVLTCESCLVAPYSPLSHVNLTVFMSSVKTVYNNRTVRYWQRFGFHTTVHIPQFTKSPDASSAQH